MTRFPHDVANGDRPIITHRENDDGRNWWCNIHQRPATHIMNNSWQPGDKHVCAPGLGGVMLPCDAVDITDEIEIDGE